MFGNLSKPAAASAAQQPSAAASAAQQPSAVATAFAGNAPTATGNPLASMFSGISNARASIDSNYLRSGTYWMRCDRCKVDRNRKGIVFCAVEMTTVRVIDNAQGLGHSLGEQVSWYIDMNSDYFLSEVRTFVANIAGADVSQVTEAESQHVFGDQQPFAGLCIEVSARQVNTKRNTTFTKVSFRRSVPPVEVVASLPPDIVQRVWPGGGMAAAAAQG
jgi:hypothetical protein